MKTCVWCNGEGANNVKSWTRFSKLRCRNEQIIQLLNQNLTFYNFCPKLLIIIKFHVDIVLNIFKRNKNPQRQSKYVFSLGSEKFDTFNPTQKRFSINRSLIVAFKLMFFLNLKSLLFFFFFRSLNHTQPKLHQYQTFTSRSGEVYSILILTLKFFLSYINTFTNIFLPILILQF